MIYIEPYGGLCNRLRCISSAYRYAEEHDYSLTIIWCALDELNSDFKSLFSLSGKVKVRIISIPHADEKYFKRILFRVIRKLLKKKCKNYYNGDDILKADMDQLDGCYITSYSKWYPTDNPYSMLVPNPAWYSRVTGYFENHKGKTVGVHIRRTDNTVSIKTSTMDSFYSKIDELLTKDSEIDGIYAASDELNAIEELSAHYPDLKVDYLRDIDRRRSSKKGIEDAAVELYILANCSSLVASYYSSFSDTAAEINGIKKYVAGK